VHARTPAFCFTSTARNTLRERTEAFVNKITFLGSLNVRYCVSVQTQKLIHRRIYEMNSAVATTASTSSRSQSFRFQEASRASNLASTRSTRPSTQQSKGPTKTASHSNRSNNRRQPRLVLVNHHLGKCRLLVVSKVEIARVHNKHG
jgi:hypothetical protein